MTMTSEDHLSCQAVDFTQLLTNEKVFFYP